jgi:hypothetical protein
MAWNYTNAPGTANAAARRDAVRSLTGDKVSTNQLLTDEEIAFYLANNSNNLYSASADACEAIAALYAQKADSLTLGKTKVDYQEASSRFLALAAKLRKQRASVAGGFFAGGASVAHNLANAENSDVVQPQSYTGRDNYPGTTPPLGTVEQEGA